MFDISNIYQSFVDEFDVYKFLRLVVIVGGYIILRQRAMTYMKARQLRVQLENDKKKKEQGLIDRPEDVTETTAIEASESSWGWGKKTRKRVKNQQKLFEEEIERAAMLAQKKDGYDSDDEIKELLVE